jgi:hypothetical protein
MTIEPSREPVVARLLPAGSSPQVVAIIWATVDADRVIAGGGLPAEALPDDTLLGAAVRLIRPLDGQPIALLEPTTEGPITLTLARHGEGPAGQYVLATGGLRSAVARAAAAGIAIKRSGVGPFGPSALVPGGPAAGPHIVLVADPAGTIDR